MNAVLFAVQFCRMVITGGHAFSIRAELITPMNVLLNSAVAFKAFFIIWELAFTEPYFSVNIFH